ncbi:MAG: beta-N-acetylglucosaminidase domain-containing protein [Propionibacteriaceae bacterium]
MLDQFSLPGRRLVGGLSALALLAGLGLAYAGPTPAAAGPPDEIPTVVPTPQQIESAGAPVKLKRKVTVVTGQDTDPAALELLQDTLAAHDVDVTEEPWWVKPRQMSIHLGKIDRKDVDQRLESPAVDEAEGYGLSVDQKAVTIGGVDAAGQYYGVRTLTQLITGEGKKATIAQVDVADHPKMPLRGTIEGFYGKPWSHEERLDQLDFYGTVKMNTYIYAPKDDPYHREKWAEPYPEEKVAELAELVERAADHHVRFTFALSPGNSICFSSEDHRAKLIDKLQSMYDIGVRSFSIPLDDIDYGTWHCDSDAETYGEAGAANAGKAQVDLLNFVQQEFIETHEGTQALQMVPTEYSDTKPSPYKNAFKEGLDEDVVIMWTGVGVVPESIKNADAEAVAAAWGRKVFVWDNYPVNDFGDTTGRLLLAPYDKREEGLSDHLLGLVSNPMNQSGASKIAITGMADFAWKDTGYDAQRTWEWAFGQLTDDEATQAALLTFGDLNHKAPTFGGEWQPQAPQLAALGEPVLADPNGADLADLQAYADRMVAAPELIRTHVADALFLSDTEAWLDGTGAWGKALRSTLAAIVAHRDGEVAEAKALSDLAGTEVAAAKEVEVDDQKNKWSQDGPVQVRIGDGVLDQLITKLRAEVDPTLKNWAEGSTVTASGVELDREEFSEQHVADGDLATRWSSDYADDAWVQLELAQEVVPAEVTVHWEDACALGYVVQTSADGETWTDTPVDEPSCGTETTALTGDEPVRFIRIQGAERKLPKWGYSIWEIEVRGTPAG